jgi:hypothetical protein
MIEICYRLLCIIIILFIISLFCYQIIKSNSTIESIELTDLEIAKMGNVETELSQLKKKQANLIQNIYKIKHDTDMTTINLKNDKNKIDAALKKSRKQSEDAMEGKVEKTE